MVEGLCFDASPAFGVRSQGLRTDGAWAVAASVETAVRPSHARLPGDAPVRVVMGQADGPASSGFVHPAARSGLEGDEAPRGRHSRAAAHSSDWLDDVAPRPSGAHGVMVRLLWVGMVALTVFGFVRTLP